MNAEAVCRGFLANATARQLTVSRAAPEVPSAEYLAGAGAGREEGVVLGLALALSVITGESPGELAAGAGAQAAVDLAFPFDLHVSS